jgi:hypothetical protein
MALSNSARVRLLLLLCLLALAAPFGTAHAQPQPVAAFKLEQVDVGFMRYDNSTESAFKSGLWAPVYITFSRTSDGNIILPVGKDGVTLRSKLTCSVTDAEETQGIYPTDVQLDPGDKATVITYAHPGTLWPDLTLGITPPQGHNKYNLSARSAMGGKAPLAVPMGCSVYLTVGDRLSNFDKAITTMAGKIQGAPARYAVFEIDPGRLPDRWFGYQAIDLLILTTGRTQIVDEFLLPKSKAGEERLEALIEWVQRGGHLVISIARQRQDKVQQFLKSPAWRPKFPDVLTRNETVTLKSDELRQLDTWTGSRSMLADEGDTVTVPLLRFDRSADIPIYTRQGDKFVPLLMRFPYGLGSVSLVALELDAKPFTTWEDNQKFWQRLVTDLGPRSRWQEVQGEGVDVLGVQPDADLDISSRLHRELDFFNVPMISFGWVALFIFLYVLVVGPLDYLILKKVFKRLEWTWITFPAVVIGISVIAYFTAYALKGDQMKINKIDLVDVDLRTDLNKDFRTAGAYAYGTTWFSLLSPRIQNYTIGLTPAGTWAGKAPANAAAGEVMMTWMGRPDTTKSRAAGLFRRAYDYAPDAAGLLEVPIPVWTTKAFTASWQTVLTQPPLSVDLHYELDADQTVRGTIQNNLPVVLEDAYLFYGDRAYKLPRNIAAKDEKDSTYEPNLANMNGQDVGSWLGKDAQFQARNVDSFNIKPIAYRPTPLIKQLFFFDKLHIVGGSTRNHSLRPLDQSWRLKQFPAQLDELSTTVRTAILVARLARAEGNTYQLHTSNDPHLPTQLWLGALPGDKDAKNKLNLSGTMIQDTYIRIFIPVRPKM